MVQRSGSSVVTGRWACRHDNGPVPRRGEDGTVGKPRVGTAVPVGQRVRTLKVRWLTPFLRICTVCVPVPARNVCAQTSESPAC